MRYYNMPDSIYFSSVGLINILGLLVMVEFSNSCFKFILRTPSPFKDFPERTPMSNASSGLNGRLPAYASGMTFAYCTHPQGTGTSRKF